MFARQSSRAALAVRLVLGAVMLWAGLAKITDLRASDAAVAAYGLVSPEAARLIGGALPFAEIAAGVLLLAGAATRLVAMLAAGLMSVYIAAIASAWARGLSIDCGCFGGGGPVTQGAQHGYIVDIVRDVLLLGGAVFLSWHPRAPYAVDNRLARTEAGAVRAPDAAVRELVLRLRRRQRGRLASLLAMTVIVAAAVAGVAAIQADAAAPARAPGHVPAGAAGDKADDKAGVLVSAGPVRVDIYFDYLCPECRIVERSIAPVIAALEDRHEIDLIYHPLGFLDSYSNPPGYSSRAAAAAACAADQGKLSAYTKVLFSRQPPEHGPGLSTEQLIAAGSAAGITSPSFTACVRSGKYAVWVGYVSSVAYSKNIAITPTIFVNGQQVDVTGPDPGAVLSHAVATAARTTTARATTARTTTAKKGDAK